MIYKLSKLDNLDEDDSSRSKRLDYITDYLNNKGIEVKSGILKLQSYEENITMEKIERLLQSSHHEHYIDPQLNLSKKYIRAALENFELLGIDRNLAMAIKKKYFDKSAEQLTIEEFYGSPNNSQLDYSNNDELIEYESDFETHNMNSDTENEEYVDEDDEDGNNYIEEVNNINEEEQTLSHLSDNSKNKIKPDINEEDNLERSKDVSKSKEMLKEDQTANEVKEVKQGSSNKNDSSSNKNNLQKENNNTFSNKDALQKQVTPTNQTNIAKPAKPINPADIIIEKPKHSNDKRATSIIKPRIMTTASNINTNLEQRSIMNSSILDRKIEEAECLIDGETRDETKQNIKRTIRLLQEGLNDEYNNQGFLSLIERKNLIIQFMKEKKLSFNPEYFEVKDGDKYLFPDNLIIEISDKIIKIRKRNKQLTGDLGAIGIHLLIFGIEKTACYFNIDEFEGLSKSINFDNLDSELQPTKRYINSLVPTDVTENPLFGLGMFLFKKYSQKKIGI